MKIAIIGGSGKMGRWFASFLLKDGHEVIITGRNQSKLLEAKQQLGVEVASNEEAVKQADAVLPSVPIDGFQAVVEQLTPYTHSGQVIVDITSIKVFPVGVMHKHIKAGVVLGAHPMFGPGARSIDGQNFVLTPTNDKETALAEKIKKYLDARHARATIMTPNEHDEMMAVILGLSHFIAIVSADTLVSLDRLKQMEAIGGSTYKVLLTLAGSAIAEDPEFYAALQMNLPNMREIERLFQTSAKAWGDLVKDKNRQEFINRMNALKDRLEKDYPNFRKAYKNMYKLVEEL